MPTQAIVGAYYRPPAKALLAAIAVGTRLRLIAEPTNPYDSNAIAIWLDTADIPESAHDKLNELLPGYGYDLDTILADESWHVGYIKATEAAQLRAGGWGDDEEREGAFTVGSAGGPLVRF